MAGDFDEGLVSHDKDGMDLDEKNKTSFKGGEMDIDEGNANKEFSDNKLVKNIGKVVRELRGLGFTSMTEDSYASAIFMLLKVRVCSFMQCLKHVHAFKDHTLCFSPIIDLLKD